MSRSASGIDNSGSRIDTRETKLGLVDFNRLRNKTAVYVKKIYLGFMDQEYCQLSDYGRKYLIYFRL